MNIVSWVSSKINSSWTCPRRHHKHSATLADTLPLSFSVYKSWHSFRIFSFNVTADVSRAFAEVLCRPDGIFRLGDQRFSLHCDPQFLNMCRCSVSPLQCIMGIKIEHLSEDFWAQLCIKEDNAVQQINRYPVDK